jgi:opacity protein-like surface antigen
MNKYLLSAVCMAACVGVGQAADLPMKAPIYAPAGYSWSGFYLGAHVGAAANDLNASVFDTLGAGLGLGGVPSGFVFGVEGGWDAQIAQYLVFGVYAEQDFANLSTTAAGALSGVPVTLQNATNYFGSAGARFGVLVTPQVLAYGKAGFGWGGAKPNFSALTSVQAVSDTSVGWAAGGGLEWGFAPHWSLKAEYMHYQLGDVQLSLTLPGGGAPTFTNTTHYAIDKGVVGLSYRF